ncbi:MAG: sigma-70 family RNA polymerase sigma factor [Candidatus Peribacteraceae bacterium]|jgi:RNA polymerase sigma-70 factor (ECF subfamily)
MLDEPAFFGLEGDPSVAVLEPEAGVDEVKQWGTPDETVEADDGDDAVERAEIEAFVRGENNALYEKYHVFVIQMLYRLGVGQDVHDMSQHIWIQVIRKADQIRNAHAFPGWLRSTVRHMVINHGLRKKGRQECQGDFSVDGKRSKEPLPLEACMQQETRVDVARALQRLKPLDRRMLQEFYFQGMSLKEMSEAGEGTPIGTIKRRLHVARKRLAKVLEDMRSPAVPDGLV